MIVKIFIKLLTKLYKHNLNIKVAYMKDNRLYFTVEIVSPNEVQKERTLKYLYRWFGKDLYRINKDYSVRVELFDGAEEKS